MPAATATRPSDSLWSRMEQDGQGNLRLFGSTIPVKDVKPEVVTALQQPIPDDVPEEARAKVAKRFAVAIHNRWQAKRAQGEELALTAHPAEPSHERPGKADLDKTIWQAAGAVDAAMAPGNPLGVGIAQPAMRALKGAADIMPSRAETPEQSQWQRWLHVTGVPPAKNEVERLQEGAGQVAVYGGVGGLTGLPGVVALSAASPGTPKERAARAVAFGAGGVALGAAESAAAPILRSAAPVVRAAVGQAAPAVTFGALVPVTEAGIRNLLGERTQLPSPHDMVVGSLEMLVYGLAGSARHEAINRGRALTEATGGRPVTLSAGGETVEAVPVASAVHPDGQVRMLVRRADTGDLSVAAYRNLDELRSSISPVAEAVADTRQALREGQVYVPPKRGVQTAPMEERLVTARERVEALRQQIAERPQDARRAQWQARLDRAGVEVDALSRRVAEERQKKMAAAGMDRGVEELGRAPSPTTTTPEGRPSAPRNRTEVPRPAPEVRPESAPSVLERGGRPEPATAAEEQATAPAAPQPRPRMILPGGFESVTPDGLERIRFLLERDAPDTEPKIIKKGQKYLIEVNADAGKSRLKVDRVEDRAPRPTEPSEPVAPAVTEASAAAPEVAPVTEAKRQAAPVAAAVEAPAVAPPGAGAARQAEERGPVPAKPEPAPTNPLDRVHPEVREAFFPAGREHEHFGSTEHGEALGRMIERDPERFTPENQTHILSAAHSHGMSPRSMEAFAHDWHSIARERGIAPVSPAHYANVAGRLYAGSDRLAHELREHKSPEMIRASASELKTMREALASARTLTRDALRSVAEGKATMDDALDEVADKVGRMVDKLPPMVVGGWGFPNANSGEMRPGRILNFFARRVNIPEAIRRRLRENPALNNLDWTDNNGNLVQREPIIPRKHSVYDAYSSEATVRLRARGKFASGHEVFIPPVYAKMRAGELRFQAMAEDGLKGLRAALGPEGMKLLVKGGRWDRLLFDYLDKPEGQRPNIPDWLKPIAERFRILYDARLEQVNKDRVRRGMETIEKLPDYQRHNFVGVVGKDFDGLRRMMGDGKSPKDLGSRFLLSRVGTEGYENPGAIQAWEDYNHATSRYCGYGDFLDAMRVWRGDAEVVARRGWKDDPEAPWHGTGSASKGRMHYEDALDYFRSVYLAPRLPLERNLGAMLGGAMFNKARGGVKLLAPDEVDGVLGRTEGESAKEIAGHLGAPETGDFQYALVPAKSEVTFTDAKREGGTRWKLLGETKRGDKVYAGPEASHIQDVTTAELRGALNVAYRGWKSLELALSGKAGNPEARLADLVTSQKQLDDFSQSPLDRMASFITNNDRRARLGANTRSWNVMAIGNLMESMGAHGFTSFARGTGDFADVMGRKSLRAFADWSQRRGFLSVEHAESLRRLAPRIAREVIADMPLGELTTARRDFHVDMQRAQARTVMEKVCAHLLTRLDMMHPLGAIGATTRAWSWLVACEAAKAEGRPMSSVMDEMVRSEAEAEAIREKFLEGMASDTRSLPFYAAQGEYLTLGHYSEAARVPLQMGAVGRMWFSLTQFGRHYIFVHEVPGIKAMGKVAWAAGRATLGLRSGVKEPRGHIGYGVEGDPLNPVDAFLQNGGADAYTRRMATVYSRRMAVASVLGMLGTKAGVNLLIYSSPAAFVALMNLLHKLNPDDETIKTLARESLEGAFAHATMSAGAGGPLINTWVQGLQQTGKPPKDATFSEAMAWYATHGLGGAAVSIGRTQLHGRLGMPEYATRRLVTAYPEVVEKYAPWMYDAEGVKSTLSDADVRTRFLYMFGWAPVAAVEEGRVRRNQPERGAPGLRSLPGLKGLKKLPGD